MDETRRARIASSIRRELSQLVPNEIRDPRVPSVTFTRVELTPDAGHATVYLMLFGTGGSMGNVPPSQMKDCLDGLNSASGFLRKQLGRLITVRHIPYLLFKEDRGFENVHRVNELLREIGSQAASTPKSDSSGGDPE
ncbi:MAG: 30S ribosome-binding factor RbfA [Bdellovibrionota bacterium]